MKKICTGLRNTKVCPFTSFFQALAQVPSMTQPTWGPSFPQGAWLPLPDSLVSVSQTNSHKDGLHRASLWLFLQKPGVSSFS